MSQQPEQPLLVKFDKAIGIFQDTFAVIDDSSGSTRDGNFFTLGAICCELDIEFTCFIVKYPSKEAISASFSEEILSELTSRIALLERLFEMNVYRRNDDSDSSGSGIFSHLTSLFKSTFTSLKKILGMPELRIESDVRRDEPSKDPEENKEDHSLNECEEFL